MIFRSSKICGLLVLLLSVGCNASFLANSKNSTKEDERPGEEEDNLPGYLTNPESIVIKSDNNVITISGDPGTIGNPGEDNGTKVCLVQKQDDGNLLVLGEVEENDDGSFEIIVSATSVGTDRDLSVVVAEDCQDQEAYADEMKSAVIVESKNLPAVLAQSSGEVVTDDPKTDGGEPEPLPPSLTWSSDSFNLTEDVAFSIAPEFDVQSSTFAIDSDKSSCDDLTWVSPLSINNSSGELNGTPGNATVGTCSLTVTAILDSFFFEKELTLVVANVNDPVVWDSTISDTNLIVGNSLAITAVATEIDPGSTVTYQLESGTTCDSGATWTTPLAINSATGDLSGDPVMGDIGHCEIVVSASSDGDTIQQNFRLSVFPPPLGGLCDAGSLDTTCTVNSLHVLNDGDWIGGPGNLVIANGGIIRGGVYSDEVSVFMGSTITVEDGGLFNMNSQRIESTDITLEANGGSGGGIISVDELGNQGVVNATGNGSGGGIAGGNGAGGGSYGGMGGTSTSGNTGGSLYGMADTNEPTELGSAGGGSGGQAGGSGGGRLKLIVHDTVNLEGSITAEGGVGPGIFNSPGGGSGGSILIIAENMTGSGTLSAAGGEADFTGGGHRGGGGGGGRIGVNVAGLYQFGGIVNLQGGHCGGDGALDGGLGTFRTVISNPCDEGDLATSCTINTKKVFGDNFSMVGTGSLLISSPGSVHTPVPLETISIQMDSAVVFNSTEASKANFSLISGSTVLVNTGATLDATGLGHPARTFATGLGFGGGVSRGGGAGFGGDGGRSSYAAGSNGVAYGDKNVPEDFGSSGASGSANLGLAGAGGGKIKIVGDTSIAVLGTIIATGGDGAPVFNGGGGGSGGSIYLSAPVVSGTGVVRANGGDGLTSGGGHAGGGGGGGRISIVAPGTETLSTSGTVEVIGGIGQHGGADDGQTGTICVNGAGVDCP